MKTAIISIFIVFSIFSTKFSQNLQIAGEYPSQGVKIYSLMFIDSNNGWAKSFLGITLKTTDGGKTWVVVNQYKEAATKTATQKDVSSIWSADIFCSVAMSNDGGITWNDYPKKQEEHFCQVYFKDENTGWKVAEEFLNGVTDTIKKAVQTGEYESKSGFVHKCREYYTNMDEGWTLGWCYKNLVLK
jgi:hypothetical protein